MIKKICTQCGKNLYICAFNTRPDRPSGYRSECRQCQYATQYKRERAEPHKIRAKERARIATKKGILQKPLFCENCHEDKPLDRHHPNYNKPLKVEWLCRKCHSLAG